MPIPPGVTYIAHRLPHFALPGAALLLLLRAIESKTGVTLPLLLRITLFLVARHTIFFLDRSTKLFRYARAAKALGATLPPVLQKGTFEILGDLKRSVETGYPTDAFYIWSKEAGPTYLWRGLTHSTIITLQPEHIKAILATQFDDFEKGKMHTSLMDSMLGQGIFNVDGDIWKFHRSLTRPFFTRERISDFEICDQTCEQSLQLLRKRVGEGYSLNIQDVVSRFTLDTTSKFLFGNSVASLSAGLAYPKSAPIPTPATFQEHPSNEFLDAFARGITQIAHRIGFGADWPLMEFWKDNALKMRQTVDAFLGPIVEKALDDRGERLSKGEQKAESKSLLDDLVDLTQDPKFLRDELMNILIAGRDSTACLLTCCIYILSQRKDMEQRLRAEIFAKVGPTQRPTYDQIREMKFMRAFINEVLRLYPPVPIDGRASKRAVLLRGTVPGAPPLYIPKDTQCMYPIMYLHRRKELWGPDALEFDPDRFLDDRLHKYLTPNPFIFIPFHAGPRICLGQQFAYNEASFFLIRLLQQFTSFELNEAEMLSPPDYWKTYDGREKDEKIYLSSHVTMSVKGGLWINMKEYKHS